MVAPILGALIGAGANVAGGIMGAKAQDSANMWNWYINMYNMAARERERQETIREARRIENDQKLGTTDASGNRVHFVPGKGWVSELSAEGQSMHDAQQREMMQQLTVDLPTRRRRQQATDVRQDAEGQMADALLNAFQRVQRESPETIEQLMNLASSKGINEGFDNQLNAAMRSAIRTNPNAVAAIDSRMGKERASALDDAFLRNKLGAREISDNRYGTERNNLANMYNMFATRASQPINAAFQAQPVGNGDMISDFANRATSAGGALVNAFAKQGGSIDYIEPNMGWGNAMASGGNAIAAAFERIGAANDRSGARNDMSMYTFGMPYQQMGYQGLPADTYRDNVGLF